jgi:uncharacterized protein YbjT (DUF2867 family)
MNYVITGGAGHISKPLAEKLLKAGHTVTVIGRNAENLKPLTDQGAKAALGSVDDLPFLKEAFRGADAVYTMVPPAYHVTDWKAYIHSIGKNYAEAIKANNIRYAVNLSSIGAHLPKGVGPVSGLHFVEQELNAVEGLNVVHLRPGFFFYNFLALAPLAKHNQIIGGNYGNADTKMILSDTADIADAAAEELLSLSITGHKVRYLASDERSFGDVAKVFGSTIGNPNLPWVDFSDEQNQQGLVGAGLPEEIAKNYTEMGSAIRTGIMMEDYHQNHPATFGKIKLEDFAPAFAAAYKQN